jgi:hypothetical protein
MGSVNAFQVAASINSGSTINVNGGSIDVMNTTTALGNVNLASGTLQGTDISIASGATLAWSGGTVGSELTVDGTANITGSVDATNVFTVNGQANISNNATVSFQQGTTHAGNVDIAAGSTLIVGNGAMTHSQTYNGNLTGNGTFSVTGQNSAFLNSVNFDGTMLLAGNTNTTITGNSTIENVDLSGTARILSADTININNLNVVGSVGQSAGFASGGTFNVGTMTASDFHLASGTTVNLNGVTNWNSGNFANAATIGPVNGGTVNNNGTLNVLDTGTSTLWATNFVNNGTVNVSGNGTLVANNGYTQSAGATNLGTGTLQSISGVQLDGGILRGEGTVDGNLTVANAVVSPGLVDNDTGTLAITGDLVMNGGGQIAADIESMMDYDRIDVSGSVTLNPGAILSADLVNGASLVDVLGMSFPIVNAIGSDVITGEFDVVNALDNFSVNTDYSDPSIVQVALAETLTSNDETADEINDLLDDEVSDIGGDSDLDTTPDVDTDTSTENDNAGSEDEDGDNDDEDSADNSNSGESDSSESDEDLPLCL